MNIILVSAFFSAKARRPEYKVPEIPGANPGSDKSTGDDEANGG